MLPPLLGKTFFKKRKLPVAINLKKAKSLRSELELTVGGTFFRHSKGTSNSVKVVLTLCLATLQHELDTHHILHLPHHTASAYTRTLLHT